LAPPSGTAVVLSTASDLSSFSFYQRGSASEFMTFMSKTVTERTPQGQRQTVQEQSNVAHVYNRGGAEQLAGSELACIVHISLLTVVPQPSLSLIRNTLPDLLSRYSPRFSMISLPKFHKLLSATLRRSLSQTSIHTFRNIKILVKRIQ
jgi:hypothetical protein